jgi:hypothetical protein
LAVYGLGWTPCGLNADWILAVASPLRPRLLQEYPVERFYRDAPLMVVGEGTNEIQRSVFARQLAERGGLPWGSGARERAVTRWWAKWAISGS